MPAILSQVRYYFLAFHWSYYRWAGWRNLNNAIVNMYKNDKTCAIAVFAIKNVARFAKTGPNGTRTETQFTAWYTHVLSRNINCVAIHSQVCFHRWLCADRVKPHWCITGPVGPLGHTNQSWCGVKLLTMSVSSLSTHPVGCVHICHLLRWGTHPVGCVHICHLWGEGTAPLYAPYGRFCPPLVCHPPPPPSHPLYTRSVILQGL